MQLNGLHLEAVLAAATACHCCGYPTLPSVGAGQYPGKGHATAVQASFAVQVPQASTWQVALAGPH